LKREIRECTPTGGFLIVRTHLTFWEGCGEARQERGGKWEKEHKERTTGGKKEIGKLKNKHGGRRPQKERGQTCDFIPAKSPDEGCETGNEGMKKKTISERLYKG